MKQRNFTLNLIRSLADLMPLLLLVLLGLAFAFALPQPMTLHAQNRWQPARPIPEYGDIYPPYLVADQNGTVHAFYTQEFDDERRTGIFYRQWSLQRGWSKPVDIILGPAGGTLRMGGVFLDQAGIVHLAYVTSRTPDAGIIYHSAASALQADQARKWSEPTILDERAGPLFFAGIIGSQEGDLTVVYTGQQLGPGVYEVHTNDGGEKWSEPTAISLVFEEDRLPVRVQLATDEQAGIHAVWSVVDAPTAQGLEVYHARSTMNEAGWSEPFLIAELNENDFAADWPSIIVYDGEVFVFYEDGGPAPTRWMRRSADHGVTWSSPVRPFPHVGENGRAVLLKDSNNTLHIVLSNRVGSPPVGGTWHGTWLGTRWSELELITPRSEAEARTTGSYAYDIVGNSSRPHAVISQGNVLLVTWWHDMQESPPAGYTYGVLDAPELPRTPLPAPAAVASQEEAPTPFPTSVAASTPLATPEREGNFAGAPLQSETGTPGSALMIGIGPPFLLVLLSLIVVLWRVSVHSRMR